MNKVFFSIIGMLFMCHTSLQAGDLKIKKGKHVGKTEKCGKDCQPTTNCHPLICPSKLGCVCK